MLGDAVEELGGNPVVQGCGGNGKESGFSTQCEGKPLEGVQWENTTEGLTILEMHPHFYRSI